jgi:hypothetical protein
MFAILSTFSTLLNLFPLVIQAIQVAEAAFPHANAGAAKLEMVKGMVASAYQTADTAGQAFEIIAPGVEAMVKTGVAIFNAAGSFKTAAPAAPGAAPAQLAQGNFPALIDPRTPAQVLAGLSQLDPIGG